MSRNDENVNEFELSIELVNILHKNTNLSYTVCSQSLIDLFQHLKLRLPHLNDTSNSIINTVKVRIN